ncbi:fumarate/nitrate reduction transcriptional regulator Fnr [Parahaliea mediterranea]|uniref:Fumarate/nitrate reduction transcriptional regulator Fnr n=1 Tax=Parahaliea mediterranea TaxID=651086 RepID=A0A939DHX2_9GAMM|nr:fumarate/nitrate reduction transcriptional regulator Fnr [Parahaliea mediterranea]MBN7797842.1 fumarate/nitrate reduction transcriptional regulator Fnr [Parahaliea mediterranea]
MDSRIIRPVAERDTAACGYNPSIRCGDCRLSGICLPLALETGDIDQLDNIIQRGRPLQRNAHLYREGDAFKAVYAVRSGALKAYRTTDAGREQVTGFYLPGEILGLDGIADERHGSSAVALETSAICEIPFEALEKLSIAMPRLQRHFLQLMSREISDDQQLITLLGKNTAAQRVIALLLSLSSRNARQHLSATRIRLPMSRTDIGNYLGLTVETVSRTLTRLQRDGLLRVDSREVELLDATALAELVNDG